MFRRARRELGPRGVREHHGGPRGKERSAVSITGLKMSKSISCPRRPISGDRLSKRLERDPGLAGTVFGHYVIMVSKATKLWFAQFRERVVDG